MPGIKEQIGVELFLNDQPVPTGQSTYGTIQVVETIKYVVPFMRFDLDDTTFKLADERQITEGTKIKSRFYRFSDENKAPFSKFIVMRKPTGQRSPEGTTPQYWYAFLDAPEYWGKVEQMSVRGTSADVVTEVAGKCGLKPFVDPTADNQVWLNYNDTLARFLKKTVAHGYVDNSSTMALACTARHELLYRDLATIFKNKPKLRIIVGGPVGSFFSRFAANIGFAGDGNAYGEDGVREVFGFQDRPSTNAGSSNAYMNYGYHQHYDDFGSAKSNQKYKAKKYFPNIHINPELKSKIGLTRVDHYRMGFGNTHKKYVQAAYQNSRGLALFSEQLIVMVNNLTDVRLFDVVDVRMFRSPDDATLLHESGLYVVVIKSASMKNGRNYQEKLVLVRNGTFRKGDTPLL
mgnify:CR=1 FL=1